MRIRSSLAEIFDSEVETAVAPFENSFGGGVEGVIDLLGERDVAITGEVVLAIDHCLLSRGTDLGTIEGSRSHSQALAGVDANPAHRHSTCQR